MSSLLSLQFVSTSDVDFVVVVPEVPELAVLSGAHASEDLLHSSFSLSSARTSKYSKIMQTYHMRIC